MLLEAFPPTKDYVYKTHVSVEPKIHQLVPPPNYVIYFSRSYSVYKLLYPHLFPKPHYIN